MEVYFVRVLTTLVFLCFLPLYLTFHLFCYILRKGAEFIAHRIPEDEE